MRGVVGTKGPTDMEREILQATQQESHTSFQGVYDAELINCGTYNAQPIFVIRNEKIGGQFVYTIHACR